MVNASIIGKIAVRNIRKYGLIAILFLCSNSSFAIVTSTMTTVSSRDYAVTQTNTTVNNMPRVRSQDSLGVCFGFSSATVTQHYICQQRKISCNPLSETKELSPISMVAWANPNDPNKRAGTWTNHSNIRFSGMGYGALGHFTLDKNNMTFSESCYPFDQFANRYGDDKDAVEAIVEKLKIEYNSFKTEGRTCEECLLNLVQKDLGAKTTLRDLVIGLKQKTFEQFLYTVFVGSCENGLIEVTPPAKMNMFQNKMKPQTTTNSWPRSNKFFPPATPLYLMRFVPFTKMENAPEAIP